ncbi:MAG: hypothetical protein IT328_26750 [Caldilineaceae bacterium]|nr:hypothetical protein [Caldilineaceae bacterium]
MSQPPVTLGQADMATLIERFAPAEAVGVFLAGSRARGNAGPYSDVDWIRLARDDAGLPGDGSYLIDGRLVVVSTLTPAFVETIFSEPAVACDYLMGLRTAQILLDGEGQLARLQRRARDFVWDATMQSKADLWAAEQMVGIIEEAHKGLEGVRRHDIGRMLNARFGLSWILSGIVKVQRGVLLSSDNGVWDDVNRAVGETTAWVKVRSAAFGIDDGLGRPPALRDQVLAGLRLYVLTADLITRALSGNEGELVRATVARINDELERIGHGEPSHP